jgi:hypothetical protein
MTDHDRLFDFESEHVVALERIPMAVRFKLDRCGVTVTMAQWRAFTWADRRELMDTPCEAPAEIADYRRRLIGLVAARTNEAARPLADDVAVRRTEREHTPPEVRTFAQSRRVPSPPDAAWGRLSALQRFALLKLSDDNPDNDNFVPALREFGLI